MKAAVLESNASLEIRDVPMPMVAADECLIKIEAAGICSSDIYRGFEKGAYFYPLIMGHEFAGSVETVGSSVRAVKKGQRVAVFPLLPCRKCKACEEQEYARCSSYGYYGSRQHGAFAEFISVKEWNLLPLPDSVAIEDAAALEPFSVVLHALKRGGFESLPPEASVAVVGAGFLGLLSAALIRLKRPDLNLRVIDRNAFKLKNATDAGATTFQLDSESSWSEHLAEPGVHCDLVIESCGVPLTLKNSIELCAQGGTVVWMGNPTSDLTLSKKLVSQMLRREIRLAGTWNSSYRGEQRSDWTEALSLIEQGFHPSRFITQTISLDELPSTLLKLHGHKARTAKFEQIKVMIKT